MGPPADLDHLLGGMTDWCDVQTVIRTTFQALYDVVHAQSDTVREVERRIGDVQKESEAGLSQKASANEVRAAMALVADLKSMSEHLSHQLEEESQTTLDANRAVTEETQSLRASLAEVRSAFDRQRVEVQQWRTGLEAGLNRLASETSACTRTLQQELSVTVQERGNTIQIEVEALGTSLDEQRQACEQGLRQCDARLNSLEGRLRAAEDGVQDKFRGALESLEERTQDLATMLEQEVNQFKSSQEALSLSTQQATDDMSAVLAEKATPQQLREIVREAWSKEESHITRMTRLCESKVSASEFATLTALAEGKASLADVETAAQRHAQKRLAALLTEQNIIGRGEAADIAQAAVSDARSQMRHWERKAEELTKKHQRVAAATDDLRAELRSLTATKLDRSEAESLVAGALADWVHAAQRGADAVQAAVDFGRTAGEVSNLYQNMTPDLASSALWCTGSPGRPGITGSRPVTEDRPRPTPPSPSSVPLGGACSPYLGYGSFPGQEPIATAWLPPPPCSLNASTSFLGVNHPGVTTGMRDPDSIDYGQQQWAQVRQSQAQSPNRTPQMRRSNSQTGPRIMNPAAAARSHARTRRPSGEHRTRTKG